MFIPIASAAISPSRIAENALPVLVLTRFLTPNPVKTHSIRLNKYNISFLSKKYEPNATPVSRSTPNSFSFATFLPKPAPPVTDLKLENQ